MLAGVPKHLPSLAKAFKLQQKAAKVGFDWTEVSSIWEKLDEEIAEVRVAIADQDAKAIEDELGDVLVVLSNLARFYKVSPEVALNGSNNKFISRLTYIEEALKANGKSLDESSLEEMDKYWDEAKERES